MTNIDIYKRIEEFKQKITKSLPQNIAIDDSCNPKNFSFLNSLEIILKIKTGFNIFSPFFKYLR